MPRRPRAGARPPFRQPPRSAMRLCSEAFLFSCLPRWRSWLWPVWSRAGSLRPRPCLEGAAAAFDGASEEAGDIAADREANDRDDVDVKAPALKRKADAVMGKEELSGELIEMQKKNDGEAGSGREAAAAS
ncbi:hypothetical protein THAOC_32503, partial [Thalassiosira oceanica]